MLLGGIKYELKEMGPQAFAYVLKDTRGVRPHASTLRALLRERRAFDTSICGLPFCQSSVGVSSLQ